MSAEIAFALPILLLVGLPCIVLAVLDYRRRKAHAAYLAKQQDATTIPPRRGKVRAGPPLYPSYPPRDALRATCMPDRATGSSD